MIMNLSARSMTIAATPYDYIPLPEVKGISIQKDGRFYVINNPRGIYISSRGFTFRGTDPSETVRVPFGTLGKVSIL